MAKPKKRYVCQACGGVSHRWQGQCPDCAEWNTLAEDAPATVFSMKHDLSSGGRAVEFVELDKPGALPQRQPTGLAEFDRALGGGLVPGSAILLGGDPGIGKSTLLLQAAARIAREGRGVVYVSGEEASGQVRMRAARLGLSDAPVKLAAATGVRDILTSLGSMDAPGLLVIDSIQTMHSDTIEGAPGTVSQVRGCAFELIRYAKENGVALVLVGHVTKDGSIAGPRVLEHMVDVVMSFEGERSHQYRILRALKNRFGAVDEIGVFAMAGEGLEEVDNPSMLFLSGRDGAAQSWGGTMAGWRCCWPCSNRAAASTFPRPRSISTWPVATGCRTRLPTLRWPRRWSARWRTSRYRHAAYGSVKSRSPERSARWRMAGCGCAKPPSSASIAVSARLTSRARAVRWPMTAWDNWPISLTA